MDPSTHLDHLARDCAGLLAAHAADPAAAVSSCPGWDRATLLGHVAFVHAWIGAQVEAGPTERIRLSSVSRPPEGEDLPAWFEATAAHTAEVLSTMDTHRMWPSWAGPQPGAFYPRRLAQETAVHRWDVAAGPIDAALAVDGIDELLEIFSPLMSGEKMAGSSGTIHLHATDIEGEWLIQMGSEGITFTRAHAKGDVALRGVAADLLLWAWNRVPADERFEVFGDTEVLTTWRRAAAV